MSEPTFTPINELGEFGLIDRLTEQIKINNESTIKAGGDDCGGLRFVRGADPRRVRPYARI
mgnify:CR=1 FL=1